jgi:hypothetical protein
MVGDSTIALTQGQQQRKARAMRKTNATNDDAQHLLRKMLLLGGAEVAASHRWFSEVDRWKELVFALLTRTTNLPQTTVRLLADQMVNLDLLHIPALPTLLKGKPLAPDLHHPHSRRILQTLHEGGFSHAEAVKGLTVICEAATTFSTQFSGRIQFYLRTYGDRMVKEAQTLFRFSQIDHDAVRYAFTYWLQNVLNMPLSLQDKTVKSFSEAHGLTGDQLFDAADEMNVNVALVDDLLHYFHSGSDLPEVESSASDETVRAGRRKKPKLPAKPQAQTKRQILPKQ